MRAALASSEHAREFSRQNDGSDMADEAVFAVENASRWQKTA
jgi:hypothetical protein